MTKIKYLFFRVLLAFLFQSSTADASSLSHQMIDRGLWCVSRASNIWIGLEPELPKFIGELSESERDSLKKIFFLSKDREGLKEILSNYRGPRERLIVLLQWISDQLEKTKLETESPARFFQGQSLKKLTSNWERYQNLGWTFHAKRTLSLGIDENSASSRKILQVDLGSNIHPLSIAQSMIRFLNADLVTRNQRKISIWLSRQFFQNPKNYQYAVRVMGDFKLRIPRAAGVFYENRTNKKLEREYLAFFIERDAILQALGHYSDLIQEYPEFRSATWDHLFFSDNPSLRVTDDLLSKQEFKNLDRTKINRLGPLSIENIVLAAGGTESLPPVFVHTTYDPVPVPQILNQPLPKYMNDSDNIGARLSPTEVSELRTYLSNQNLVRDATRVRLAIRLLRGYDYTHPNDVLVRNWSGAELGIKILSKLPPNEKEDNYRNIFADVLQSVYDTVAYRPKVSQMTVDAIGESPAIYGFLELPFRNMSPARDIDLFALILTSGNLEGRADYQPDPNRLFIIMHQYIYYHLEIARNSPRQDSLYIHEHTTWARNMIHLGTVYFSEIGDGRAEYFRAMMNLVE